MSAIEMEAMVVARKPNETFEPETRSNTARWAWSAVAAAVLTGLLWIIAGGVMRMFGRRREPELPPTPRPRVPRATMTETHTSQPMHPPAVGREVQVAIEHRGGAIAPTPGPMREREPLKP